MFSLVKANRVEDDKSRLSAGKEDNTDSEDTSERESLTSKTSSSKRSTTNPIAALLRRNERPICLVISVLAGVCYGVNFTPVIYMIDNPDLYPGHPTEGLAYVFSHYFGIFITATLIFIVYALGRSNQPYTPPELVLPAFLAGLMWAIAQSSFFVANQHLSQAISFPIITALPGCIASMWGIFYFREITGTRNMLTFVVALVLAVNGAILVGLSKEVRL